MIGLLAFLCVHRLVLGFTRDFDPDELQHMHGGFCIALGMTPFVDYFEHHTPWFPWIASGLIRLLGPDWSTLMIVRFLSGLVSMGTVAATVALVLRSSRARTETAWTPALATGAVLLTFLTGTDRAVEIRPDVPGALAFALAVLWLADALRVPETARRTRRALWGGLALGAGLMFTPKLAFGAIGLGLGTLLFAVRVPQHRAATLRTLVLYVLASTLPAAATAGILALQGHLGAFVRDVVVGPLDWEREIAASVHLKILIERNALHVGAALVGFGVMLLRGARTGSSNDADPTDWIVPAAGLAILAGWFVVPVPWPQFLLPLWPLAAIGVVRGCETARDLPRAAAFATACAVAIGATAVALEASGSRVVQQLAPVLPIAGAALLVHFTWRRPAPLRLGGVAAALAVLGAFTLRLQPNAATYGVLWPLTAAAIAFASRGALLSHLAAFAAVASTFVPLGHLIQYRPVAPFRAEFDQIMEHTAPDETVLTGWRGCAVFRPHAYHYFFLHLGVTQMLTDAQKDEDVLRAMEQRPPAAAIRDEATGRLGPGVQRYLDDAFEPTGVGNIWLRVR